MGCLYSLESPSGKKYIGISSKTMEARWAKHVEHALGKRSSGAIYAALRKYGPDSFKRETLVIADFEYLKELEVRAIATYGTYYPNGYNLTFGGEGATGKRTPEQLKKHSEAQIRRFQNPEERQKVKERFAKWKQDNPEKYLASIEKKRTGANKKKRVRVLIGSEEHARRTKAALARPEVREKVLASAKARAANPEWRKKVSEAKIGINLGVKHNEEWKVNQITGIKAAWADPVKKAARLEKIRIKRGKID